MYHDRHKVALSKICSGENIVIGLKNIEKLNNYSGFNYAQKRKSIENRAFNTTEFSIDPNWLKIIDIELKKTKIY